jgi:Domain of unknown function (DUF4417)
MLDLTMQADRLIVPVTKWGTIGRSLPMPGTYHFYTEDYKFQALACNPGQLLASGCAVAVEPNFSSRAGDEASAFSRRVAQKRSIARHWQDQGVRLIVDLNVEPEFREANLTGVPDGWGAYAVRCQHGIGWDVIEADYQAAYERCGGHPHLFAVVGGGKLAASLCAANGWTHVPEHRQVIEGRVKAYG